MPEYEVFHQHEKPYHIRVDQNEAQQYLQPLQLSSLRMQPELFLHVQHCNLNTCLFLSNANTLY
jgi:hypothetical protein